MKRLFVEFAKHARVILHEVLAAENTDEQVGVITMGLIRATAENCQVCGTGYGNGRGKAEVRCAICRQQPDVIVCLECAHAHKLPSWGS